MLSKKVCRKCASDNGLWTHIDGRLWTKKGIVFCPMISNFIFITDAPPDDCPYYLEYLVNENIKDAE